MLFFYFFSSYTFYIYSFKFYKIVKFFYNKIYRGRFAKTVGLKLTIEYLAQRDLQLSILYPEFKHFEDLSVTLINSFNSNSLSLKFSKLISNRSKN